MELIETARPVLPGTARGEALCIAVALSFWGGIDPHTGRLTDPSERHVGEEVAGRIMFIPETRGSSSSSAVLLQLVYGRIAPAAIVLGHVDAILGLGILVANEMKWPAPPLLILPPDKQATFHDGDLLEIAADGRILIQR